MKSSKMQLCVCCLLLMNLIGGVFSAADQKTIDYQSLLVEMVDRDIIARFPSPEYTCAQFSSYDRKTISPDKEGWFANEDWSHYIRVEENDGRKEYVMMDASGPGAIVRIWCTGPKIDGTIRIYLDDAKEPVIQGPAAGIIGGAELVTEPLSALRAKGRNLFVPIPYSKSCKVTFDGKNFWETRDREDPFYYQINYRTYEASTKVKSFTQADFKDGKKTLDQVQEQLLAQWKRPALLKYNVTAEEHGDVHTSSFLGPGAICELSLKLDSKDLQQASRSTVLEIACDGQQVVWAPVGDFFGSGVGVNPFRGWWRRVAKDGTMSCYLPMPFEKNCIVKIKKLLPDPGKMDVNIKVAEWKWDDRSMHLHANWRYKYPFKTHPHFDWNYIEIQGKGVLVADTLALLNTDSIWWGEGDEKIWVDGEDCPSHIGTGTEDYYGYAYCTPEFFEDPFHCQPRADGPRNFGRVTNIRGRSLDAVPFNKSLKFDMEIWHWQNVVMEYATTTYWYARPGATCNIKPAPEIAAQKIVPVTKPWKYVEGAIEGETMKIRSMTGEGVTHEQFYTTIDWSGGMQLLWKNGKPGDKLALEFSVEAKGTYEIKVNLTKAADYGIFLLSIDSNQAVKEVDLYHDVVVPTGEISLGKMTLDKGTHFLNIQLKGANPKATKDCMFGIDYIKLFKTE